MKFINHGIWQEVYYSITRHKVRSILTGFGVAWGIFILVMLLGVGQGFRNGVFDLFGGYAQKSLWFYGGNKQSASIYISNQPVYFDISDIQILRDNYKTEIEHIAPEVINNHDFYVGYKNTSSIGSVKATTYSYFEIKKLKPETGRLFNYYDNEYSRKFVILGNQVTESLFDKVSAIGKYINIGGTYFKVIGILESGTLFSMGEQNAVFIPYNTYVECFNKGREFNSLGISLYPGSNTVRIEEEIRGYLSRKYSFPRDDKSALYSINFEEQVKSFNKLFTAITGFLWFIGLCLLLSGMVSISNMMFIVVKERTKEIGIRKAIGAKPKSIIKMVIAESMILTLTAGILGMILGFVLIQIINLIMGYLKSGDTLISTLSINIPAIILSLIVLITAGIIAGLFPAKKASEIMPFEALNDTNFN